MDKSVKVGTPDKSITHNSPQYFYGVVHRQLYLPVKTLIVTIHVLFLGEEHFLESKARLLFVDF